jgi:hypothetical protein
VAGTQPEAVAVGGVRLSVVAVLARWEFQTGQDVRMATQLTPQVEAAVLGELSARWPGTRFGITLLGRAHVYVYWVIDPGTPSDDAVRPVVVEAVGGVPSALRGPVATVTAYGSAPLAAEAVVLVRAWRAGTLTSDSAWISADLEAEELDLGAVPAADKLLAAAVCAHAGVTDAVHWHHLGPGDSIDLRRRLAQVLTEVGDSLVLAMNQ